MKNSKGDNVDLEDLRTDMDVDLENPPPTVTEDVVIDKPIVGDYETMKWPECMAGLTGEECKQYIEKTSPDLKGNVFIIEPGMFVTEDFRLDRVRIYIDKEGMCSLIPERG